VTYWALLEMLLGKEIERERERERRKRSVERPGEDMVIETYLERLLQNLTRANAETQVLQMHIPCSSQIL
jgi:hypothetical protein